MKELKGDILLIEEGVICHQVNCLGLMGAGLAKQIKEKCPDVFKEYKEKCHKELELNGEVCSLLGFCQVLPIGDKLFIANIFGQVNIGNGKATSYDAVDESLLNLRSLFRSNNNPSVYFPKYMGCGLGGGRWDIYSAIIKSYFPTGIIVDYEKGKVPYDSNESTEFEGMSIMNYEP